MTLSRYLLVPLLAGLYLPAASAADAPKKSSSSLQLTASKPVLPPPSPVLPSMKLSGQFGGPLKDTAIQRFVDPETGVVCYLYTPYTVPTDRNDRGQIVYNANSIGNISCVAPWKSGQPAPGSAIRR